MLQAKTVHGEYLPCCRVLSVVGNVNERQLGEVDKSGAGLPFEIKPRPCSAKG
jgi:hypothetical protein